MRKHRRKHTTNDRCRGEDKTGLCGCLGLIREGIFAEVFRPGSQSPILRFERGQETKLIICYKLIKFLVISN